ncbi:hypothetical protein ACFQS1_19785 [Paractinoplanes rhizophilus]|uniref:DUF7341 domain-containing protein n=1 Tax=Paractinoplanes rhizophilus TaxID=1416877 RepID=A0ABW2HUW7_9ACTN
MTLLDQITGLADGLTDPHVNREPYTVWDGNRHRKTHHHVTVQHGLLTQLHRAVLPASVAGEGPGGGVPKSRPPLEIEALSRYRQITAAARRWCKDLGVDPRATPESTIRALVGAAGRMDDGEQRELLADLRRWVSWCRVYLGLEQIRRIAGARCPLADCAQLGSLRINLTTSYGMCTACGAAWDRDTIGVLAEHIRVARTTTPTEGAPA